MRASALLFFLHLQGNFYLYNAKERSLSWEEENHANKEGKVYPQKSGIDAFKIAISSNDNDDEESLLKDNQTESRKRIVLDKSGGKEEMKSLDDDEDPFLDDKYGLIEENPLKRSRNPNFPKLCSRDIPCQPVSSKIRPSAPQNHTRYRREAEKDGEYWNGTDCEYESRISAFGGKYDLCLFMRDFMDESIISKSKVHPDKINITVFSSENETEDISLQSLSLKYVTGFVKAVPFTAVSGFIIDDHFYGTVIMENAVHYLEPHNRKSNDMRIFGDGLKTLLHRHNNFQPFENGELNTTEKMNSNSKAKSDSNSRVHNICDLTIVADHTFYKEIGESSLEKTVLQMLWHIKEANSLIQSKEFLVDKSSNCITVAVSEITIFKDENARLNLLKGEYKVPEVFLKKFSRYNFEGFCIGILFTNRIFNDLVLGLSWRGNARQSGVGGICQDRVRMKSDSNAYSFNAIFISLRSSQEKRIPLRMGVLNLVHEILHSFGSRHDPDPEKDPACTPNDKWINGRYLMSKYSNDGHKINHEIISTCTEASVVENLKAPHRIKCLRRDKGPVCGDGFTEDEECDCGTVFQCIAAKSCCISQEGFKRGQNPCKLHSIVSHNCIKT